MERFPIVTVGVALAELLVRLFSCLWQDFTHLRAELRDDIKQLADRVGRLERSQAKLEGLLEGLWEAITGSVAS